LGREAGASKHAKNVTPFSRGPLSRNYPEKIGSTLAVQVAKLTRTGTE